MGDLRVACSEMEERNGASIRGVLQVYMAVVVDSGGVALCASESITVANGTKDMAGGLHLEVGEANHGRRVGSENGADEDGSDRKYAFGCG